MKSQQLGNLAPANFTYNAKGQLIKVVQGTRTTTLTYNAKGHVASVKDSSGNTTKFSYNAVGNVSAQTLPNGDIHKFTYDPSDQEQKAYINPELGKYAYAFNKNDMPVSFKEPLIDATSYVWHWAYNQDNQAAKYTTPNGSQLTWNYGTNGLVSKVSGPGILRNYKYTNGILNSVSWSAGDKISFTGTKNLITSAAYSGLVNGTVGYAYSILGRLQQISVNGQAVSFNYNADGELTNAGDLTITRSPTTGIIVGARAGVTTLAQTMDQYGEITQRKYTLGPNYTYTMNYQKDNLGRITSVDSLYGTSASNTQYSYDLAGRLSSVSEGQNITYYNYTSTGNRLTAGGQEVYDAQDRLLSDARWTYTYDRNGFLTRKDSKLNGSFVMYSYDLLGNLTSVENSASNSKVEYSVDGGDRRISKRVNGSLKYSLLYQDRLRPVAMIDQNNSVVATFVYGTRANSPDLMIKGGTTYRFVHDHQGSPIFLANSATGEIVQAMKYDAWGNLLSDSNPGFQPFGYAGGLYDSETGLVRFGARDYDPAVGRWINKDPIRFQGSRNLYGYVSNDPINHIDVNGLWAIIAGAGVGGYLGGGADVSAGVYFGTNDAGEFDAGFMGSASSGVGLGVSANVFVGGATSVDAISGVTTNTSAGIGPVSGTLMFDDANCNLTGGFMGFGAGKPLVSGSVTRSVTGTISAEKIMPFLGY